VVRASTYSERLYQAIKGNGGTARLVLLPHESHRYVARVGAVRAGGNVRMVGDVCEEGGT